MSISADDDTDRRVKEDRKTDFYVGLFVLLGIALLTTLIMTFGRFSDRFSQSYPIYLNIENSAGIIKGSEVRMGGAKIGKVTETPQLKDDATIRIELAIQEKFRIPQGSILSIDSASMLGDKMIVVLPPKKLTGEYIGAGSEIAGGGLSGIDAIQKNAVDLTSEAKNLMVTASQTLEKIDESVTDIKVAAGHLSKTLEKVNTSVLREENLTYVNQAIEDFASTMEKFEQASTELKPTLTDARTAIQSINDAAKGAQTTFSKVNDRVDELKPALAEIPQATRAIAQAAEKAGQTIDRVSKGQGLIGTLTSDGEVSADAKVFIRNLRERGILRYKDGDAEHPENDPRNRFRGSRR